MLNPEAVDEFKKLYFKKYGTKLSNEEATKKAVNLLTLVKAIYRPIPIENGKMTIGSKRKPS